jgi:hypothetical protein
VAPAPGGCLKCLFPGPSWPADGDGGKSLLSVLLLVTHIYAWKIILCFTSVQGGARNKLMSRGYPVRVKHDGEFFFFLC